MNLEEKILSMEEKASALVAAARSEARKLLGSLEDRKKRSAGEIAARTEEERRRLREEYARRLREKLLEIRREQAKATEGIERARKGITEGWVRAITEKILRG